MYVAPVPHLAPPRPAVLRSIPHWSIRSKWPRQLPPTRPHAAVASATAEGTDAPKANIDNPASSSAAAEEGVPEDSDADPEADALTFGQQGLLSGSMEDGIAIDKNADRPWKKNVRNVP